MNGINAFSFVLDTAPDVVRRKLRSELTIVDSCEGDDLCHMGPFEMSIVESKGKAEVLCDSSN